MKLSRIGRVSMALVASVALGLGMTACGGGTIGFMWVLGTQFNQIAGFEIDDFTGNLTRSPHSPFTSGGSNPVSLVVKPGGRYLYVVNKGTPLAPDANGNISCQAGQGGGSIAEFTVGGQGILTFQQTFQSQGCNPVWAAHDTTGNYLYVLDQFAPSSSCFTGTPVTTSSCSGDITVFSADPNTGRLVLVLNQQIKDPVTQLQSTYFAVGHTPTMLAVAGSCVFALNSADQSVFPYAAGSNGQLTLTTNSTLPTGAARPTSIISSSSSVYITDAGPVNASSPGQILTYSVGAASCSLNTITGGAFSNIAPAANPVYSLVDSKAQYVYVANQSTSNTNYANSSISAFTIQPNSTLQNLGDINNPYPVGAGPVCMVEDPSNQYIFTSNGDGTVTGKSLYQPNGFLSDLKNGSKFTAVGQATCLAVSGAID